MPVHSHNGPGESEHLALERLDETAPVWPGRTSSSARPGPTESTNFAVFSPEATAMWVSLFDDDGTETRHQLTEHTLGVWHGAIPGVAVGQRYGFRAQGPWQPERGRRFNPQKLLLDPYARAISGRVSGDAELLAHDAADPSRPARWTPRRSCRARVVVHDEFDWRPTTGSLRHRVAGHRHLRAARQGLHPAARPDPRAAPRNVRRAGRTRVIDYLRDLGVTAVELLPVHHFLDELALAERGLTNYWGYNSIGYFAPARAPTAPSGDRGQQVTEFKQMVQAPARRRHRGRSSTSSTTTPPRPGPTGPTYSFRGLDDIGFYKRRPRARGDDAYWDVTGCGNTVDSDRLRRPAADPRLAALLGHRDARRRVPVRPRLGAGPHRARRRHGAAPSSPRSARTRCCAT